MHTGTSTGVEADARMQSLLANHDYLVMADELENLPPEQAQFYRGILANRENNLKKSISLLEPLVEKVTASGDKAHEKLLREALAQDYLREGDYAKAAAAYAALESRLGAMLSADEQSDIEMPLKMAPLAAANPPMTVDPCEPFEMQVSRDPLGLTDVPVFVDAAPRSWMLDPTAPFNMISQSTARAVGLKVSEQAVTIRTLTGRPIQVHATVIPRFTIGGRLTLHNVTAFVYDDAAYFYPRTGYQVEGVLGYAALQALGSITMTQDETIEVQPAHSTKGADDPAAAVGAHFFLDGDQVIVALGQVGNERMYAVDAAGQQSYLTSRYYDEHMRDFAGLKLAPFAVPGSDALPPQPAYNAETVPLNVGGTMIQAHFLQVLTQPLGNAALDDVYGVLGVDVLDQLRSYTFDYRSMRFIARPE
ncbi:MAG: retropepsin-like aspartic protease [Acidobacteriota bacterium]